MRVDDFDYPLPEGRIAAEPPRRGDSRLMVIDRARGAWEHSHFSRLPQWLQPGDILVRNDTRVIPARLRGRREGGGEVEALLLRRVEEGRDGEVWVCLARPGKRLRPGSGARFPGGIEAKWLGESDGEGRRRVLLRARRPIAQILEEVGEMPLPPYIGRAARETDRRGYQTVYARATGAVAAPTAGLHFTDELFGELASRNVEVRDLTLHVGPGTFLPIRSQSVEEHRMEGEEVEIPPETAAVVRGARAEGRRVVAVGTTTVRALEGALAGTEEQGCRTRVSLFIYPGYRFRIVDALLTNFHLPRSTLLMLVAAFAGRELVLRAYREAVERGYRFYSYGDAMLIL